MDAQVFHDYIMFPTLATMSKYGNFNYNSAAARQLMLATAAQESHVGTYLKQVKGPALGPYQMEPPTLLDLYKNFATGERRVLLHRFASPAELEEAPLIAVVGNLHYATALARMNYRRFPAALPAFGDQKAMWAYYKKYWNSVLGAATEEDFDVNWKRFVKGVDFSDPSERIKPSTVVV